MEEHRGRRAPCRRGPGRSAPSWATRRRVILGVDRLDYTKGIELRLEAFRELLEDGTLSVPETTMVQVATPSRERVEHYEALRIRVEREVGRINGDFGRVGMPAVHYLHQSYSRASSPRSTARPT